MHSESLPFYHHHPHEPGIRLPAQDARPNIVVFASDKLRQSQPLHMVSDQFRSPTLAEDLARGVLRSVKDRKTGIFHLSGKNVLSVYDFTLHVARQFGYDESLVTPVKTSDLHEPARRPARTGLVIDKARAELGYVPVSVEEGVRIVASQMSYPLNNVRPEVFI